MTEPATGAPNRVPWPPIIYGAAGVAALVLGLALPGPGWFGGPTLRVLGWTLIVAGLGLDAAAMVTMARRRANILPHRSATALVTTGPFAWSRNPIYLGNAIVLTGAGFALANPWFFLAVGASVAAVTRLAIVREEAHLAALFGRHWEAYRRRTNRWFGRRREDA